MTSAEYWEKREDENFKRQIKDEAEYEKELRRIYKETLDRVQKEIEAFYGRYAASEGISINEAKKRVAKADIEAFERKAKKYVADREFSKEANEEMRLYNATMRINRLEMLKANIGLEMIAGHEELQELMEEVLQGRTMEELQRQAGILGKTINANAKKADSIVNASFHNATFSDRIWMYQDLLKHELDSLLQSGMIQGKNPRVLAKEIRKRFDVKASDAERLMRTELARVQTAAQKKAFEEMGYEMYRFVHNKATHKGKRITCSDCVRVAEKDSGYGKGIYLVKDMMPGVNAPPLHPNCRFSVAAHEDDAEFEAWLDYLDKGGSTEQWNKTGRKQWKKSRKVSESIEKMEESGTIPLELDISEKFKALSGDVKERSYQIDKLLAGITNIKSLWSGKTIIAKRESMQGVLGAKEWNCDIRLREDSGIKTAIHEHLHARSISRFTEAEYLKWKNIEEATVELFAQEICKQNGVSYKESYKVMVKQLKIVNSILRTHENDYDFAQSLFEMDVVDRYDWIRNKADELISKGVLSKETIEALNKAVDFFA